MTLAKWLARHILHMLPCVAEIERDASCTFYDRPKSACHNFGGGYNSEEWLRGFYRRDAHESGKKKTAQLPVSGASAAGTARLALPVLINLSKTALQWPHRSSRKPQQHEMGVRWYNLPRGAPFWQCSFFFWLGGNYHRGLPKTSSQIRLTVITMCHRALRPVTLQSVRVAKLVAPSSKLVLGFAENGKKCISNSVGSRITLIHHTNRRKCLLKTFNQQFNGQTEWSETHHGKFVFTTAHLNGS